MPYGLTLGTDRAAALQKAVENELLARGYSSEADPVMAEYICIMVFNNKSAANITSELQELIGSDFDDSFTDWLFTQAATGAPEDETAPEPEAAPSAPVEPLRDAPPPPSSAVADTNARRTPGGPRSGVYQNALNQALPGSSAQKRTASARSPSPNGHPPKTRRTDLPTGPRAMRDGPSGPGNQGVRSLLDRVGPVPPRRFDEVQARIDSITGVGGMDPTMVMQQAGFHPGMMPQGMDMANPMALQEMMMNQMALMAQMATSMGILNPATGQMGGFPPGMGGPGFDGGPGQMGGRGGRGGRGRGGPPGRGRGGHLNGGEPGRTPDATPTSAPVVAPTPVQASSLQPTPGSQGRPGFVPLERPQSPTLCKFNLKCTNPTCRYSHPSPVATPESGVVLSNDPCEKGINCTDADCIKGHVSPAVKNGGPIAAEHLKPAGVSPAPALCRYGAACARQGAGCTFSHPRPSSTPNSASGNHFATPCRFGSGCTRATCPFQHPPDRVLPGSFYRGIDGNAQLVNVKAPETGTIGANGGHNRSVTFNKPASSAAPTVDGTKPANAQEVLAQKMKELEERKRELAEKEKAMAAKKAEESKTTPAVVGAA